MRIFLLANSILEVLSFTCWYYISFSRSTSRVYKCRLNCQLHSFEGRRLLGFEASNIDKVPFLLY